MMTNPSEFSLSDVVVGTTVMRGRSTSGATVTGTISRILHGIGFRVVQENSQRSILWSSLTLVPDAKPVLVVASPSASASDAEAFPAAPALCRTDSGADYGILGFPDCAFWERNGVDPLYLATSEHYDTVSGVAPGWRVKQLLQQHRCEEEEGPFRRAWDVQMATAELNIANTPIYNTNPVIDFMEPPLSPPKRTLSPTTPARQVVAAPAATPPARMQPAVCPGAPVRPDRKISESASDGVPTLVIPDVSDHKGAGILPGDFIKPDPLMTQQETRRYILAELERFLTGRVQRHALQLDAITPAGLLTEEMETLVSAGRWPAARLFTLFAASPSKKHRQDPEIHMDFVARVALESCVKYLHGARDGSARATGFVSTDKLPNGRTIASYWNHSPFEALRGAAPLSDSVADLPLSAKAESLPLPGSPLLRQIAAPTPPFGAVSSLSPDMSPIGENMGLKLTVYEGKTYFLNEETGKVYSLRQDGMEQVAVKEGEMFVFLEESESESESEAETTDGEESEDEEYEVSDSEDEEDSDGDSAASEETEEDESDGEGEEDSDSDYVPADSVDADGHVDGWGGTLRPDRRATLRPLPHRVASTTQGPQGPQGPQGIDERIDSRIDAWTATFGRFVQAKYTFTISGANILSVWFAITVYLWIINFMLAGRR